jgi:hypothetical protein
MRAYKEVPVVHIGSRERDASECIPRRQAFAQPPMSGLGSVIHSFTGPDQR